MAQVKITYYGHACFGLEQDGYRVVLDPYGDGAVPGLPKLRLTADAVYCSHQHGDHNFTKAVTLCRSGKPVPYTVEELTVPHDDAGGAKRGMNTVRQFRFGALRIIHFGDIGRHLTQEEAARLSGADCVMIPVGGYFTVDAAAAKAITGQIRPRVIIPMHFRTGGMGYDVLSPLEDFTCLFDQVTYPGTNLMLTNQTPAGVCVLTPEVGK